MGADLEDPICRATISAYLTKPHHIKRYGKREIVWPSGTESEYIEFDDIGEGGGYKMYLVVLRSQQETLGVWHVALLNDGRAEAQELDPFPNWGRRWAGMITQG